jgi:hypothetical protein
VNARIVAAVVNSRDVIIGVAGVTLERNLTNDGGGIRISTGEDGL